MVASFVFDLSASVESCAVSRGLTEEQSRGGRGSEWAVERVHCGHYLIVAPQSTDTRHGGSF